MTRAATDRRSYRVTAELRQGSSAKVGFLKPCRNPHSQYQTSTLPCKSHVDPPTSDVDGMLTLVSITYWAY